MAKQDKQERRLQKEQAKAAKAGEKAAAKAQRRAAKPRRKAKKADLENEPVPEAQPATFRPRLELVTEPGPVKHLHWEAEQRARRAAEAARLSEPAAPAAAPREQPALPPLGGRRRTLYTTENGNQVVAYEQGGRRQLAITEERDGQLQEVPFDESQVDQVIGTPGEPTPLQEALHEAPPVTVQEEPKRGFWRRKAAAPAQPAVEHIYRPVEVVETITSVQPPALRPAAQPETGLDAWEPDAAFRQAVRPARPAPRVQAPRKAAARKPRKAAPTLRQAPRSPKRKLVRKPARAYPGDNHPVIDIEGIGPIYAKKLEKMRIGTTGLLNVAKPGRVARRLKVPAKTVRKWQAQAELIKVPGIGPQFAEALARSGVKGIDELKKRSAPDLSKQVAKYLGGLGSNVVGQPLTPKRIAAWKRKAQPMRRVKVDLGKLAVADHGLPPPWLREAAGKKAKRAARKTAKKAAKTRRSR
ncbi:MAG: hypothetical protein QOG31_413 [Thermoplasmata archaeon]|jgi:predicted flap endonuclease-1-like 5' DNA nuclease|nr:hypothetical protein [Thermoplasmata archaeon]